MKISIVTLTYGHEKYIRQAIEGILMQVGDFDLELIIADDQSPDRTSQIINEFIQVNPEKAPFIKYTRHSENIGVMNNFVWALNQCKGDYIALCDGDDYWTDTKKLQKQLKVLENSSQFSACFTDALIVTSNSEEKKKYLKKNKQLIFKPNDIVLEGGGLFPTASLLFRNVITHYPDFLLNAKSGDRALSLLLTLHGDFYNLDQVTCVYRVHDGGVFSNILHEKEKRNDVSLSNIQLLKDFNLYSDYKFATAIKKTISKLSKKILISRKFTSKEINYGLYSNLVLKDWVSIAKHKILK